MSCDGSGTALCSARSSSREQGDRQSHPFPALGPRDDAGGQLKLSGCLVPLILLQILLKILCLAPSGAAWWPRERRPLLSHFWGSAENDL